MRTFNYVELALSEKTEELKEITKATSTLFNSIKEDLFKDKNRHVKVFRDENNKFAYMLEKRNKKINVYESIIHDFQSKETTEELFKYDLRNMNEKPKEELYAYLVLRVPVRYKEAKELTNDNIFNILSEKGDVAKELINKLKQDLSDKLSDNLYIFNQISKLNALKSTSDVNTLKNYFELLNSQGHMKTVMSNGFYKELSKKLNPKVQELLEDYNVKINYLTQVSKKQGFNYDNQFEFNDLDNHVWLDGDNLILTDQTCGFYFNMKDKNNYTVYFLDHEYADINEGLSKIKERNSNEEIIEDLILEVKNNNVEFVNNAYLEILDLDLDFSSRAFEDAGFEAKKSPIDIKSYEYQKNYYYHTYQLNEFNFLAQAFLTIGGGFDYDVKEGIFYDSSVKYLKKLRVDNSEYKKETDFNYCYPKSVTYLNEDWLNGLKYMVKVLKEDRPIPIVYEGKDVQKALDKTIKYYEGVISSLENKPKVKIN